VVLFSTAMTKQEVQAVTVFPPSFVFALFQFFLSTFSHFFHVDSGKAEKRLKQQNK